MNTSTTELQTDNESDDYLIELMGLRDDFPDEAMAAYGKIYKRYWEVMFTIAVSVTKDEETAGDLLADTFNMVYQRASTFKPGRLSNPLNVRLSIQKWMTRIMQNIFYDNYLDDAYKGDKGPLEESYIIEKKELATHFDQEYNDFVEELEVTERNLDRQAVADPNQEEDSQNVIRVKEFLTKLSERDRDIILTYYNNYLPGKNTPTAILDELVKRWGTTRQNIRKILEKFRKAIKENLQPTLMMRK